MKAKFKTVSQSPSLLGECPVWDDRNETLYWVDILNGIIHSYCTKYRQWAAYKVSDTIGAIALCDDHRLIAGLEKDIVLLNTADRSIEKIGRINESSDDIRLNDGKCDPAGRFWIGSMSKENRAYKASLYYFENSTGISVAEKNITCSNGLAWSPDSKTFYFIDTLAYNIAAYDYEKATGAISNKRIIIEFDHCFGLPDGMTIDEEGMLWVAFWNGFKIARFNPVRGNCINTIEVPVARVTSCVFGGSNLQDIYITTASVESPDETQTMNSLDGHTLVIENTGFKGIKANRFSNIKEPVSTTNDIQSESSL